MPLKTVPFKNICATKKLSMAPSNSLLGGSNICLFFAGCVHCRVWTHCIRAMPSKFWNLKFLIVYAACVHQVKNPSEDKDVVEITNYIDLGLEFTAR